MRVHILGLGPAGVIAGLRAVARGWEVHGYDPQGLRVWEATYGMLDSGLPGWFSEFLGPPQTLDVKTPRPRRLPFRYRMLRNDQLVASARGMQIHACSAAPSDFPDDYVIDCRGAQAAGALWQVAVGYVLSDAPAPLFMDWTSPTVAACPPSFLYVQPVAEGWLYEETILATAADCRQPEVREELVELLQGRLRQRMAVGDGAGCDGEPAELVFIPMGTRYAQPRNPKHRNFGARAGMVNPATGYSVGAAASAVDELLDGLGEPAQQARVAHFLRNVGGQLIAQASQATLRDFFDCFFRLPAEHQVAYLVGNDGWAVAKTMWRLRQETTLRHEFLKPLFRTPWRIVVPAWRRSFPKV